MNKLGEITVRESGLPDALTMLALMRACSILHRTSLFRPSFSAARLAQQRDWHAVAGECGAPGARHRRGVRLGVRLQLPHLVVRYERLGYRITKYMTHAGYEHPTYVFMEKRF